ncbi:hypothetical protein NC653_039405 [Populus alba x Populus x berolinensis]|uniref:Uncharacterized protein n=1 Tax=Populus alba x Populus x berolinensis TaxID=444605 RepID=A0AAD6LB44_9ROSI|nr:hypothetical protein NC653_039405 [Populus alba x Populus x berolinensis]
MYNLGILLLLWAFSNYKCCQKRNKMVSKASSEGKKRHRLNVIK